MNVWCDLLSIPAQRSPTHLRRLRSAVSDEYTELKPVCGVMCRATCLQTLEGLIPRVAPGVLHRTLFVEAQLSRHWWAAVRAEAIFCALML